MTEQAPLTETRRVTIDALGATTDRNVSIAQAPFAGVVAGATFTPDANITGATSTKRTLTVENRGSDGSGTTVIGTLDFITGVNGVAYDELAFTLSATAANLVVAAEDVIALKETHASTGLANPGGLIELTFSRS